MNKWEVKRDFKKFVLKANLPGMENPNQSQVEEAFASFTKELQGEGEITGAQRVLWLRLGGSGIKV